METQTELNPQNKPNFQVVKDGKVLFASDDKKEAGNKMAQLMFYHDDLELVEVYGKRCSDCGQALIKGWSTSDSWSNFCDSCYYSD